MRATRDGRHAMEPPVQVKPASGIFLEFAPISRTWSEPISRYLDWLDSNLAVFGKDNAQGLANIHYLRHRQFFVLIATKGRHAFFEQEGDAIKDVRREPILYAGYSIGYRQGVDRKYRASVRIHPKQYNLLKSHLLEIATRRSVDQISQCLRGLPVEPYAPVRRQMLNILRAVNRKRQNAGLEPVAMEALRLRRRILKPFVDEEYQILAAEGESEEADREAAGTSVVAEKQRSVGSDGRPVDPGIPR
jgi:hypothetical protein